MLKITTLTALALVLTLGSGASQAQSLRSSDGPAEFPPASFTGKQYIDSKGCVFVRAGFDGAVNWVPRVTRKRKVLCGFQPTMAARSAPAEAPRQVAAATPPPRQVAPPQAAPRPTQVQVRPRPAPAPAPRIAAAAPRPAPVAVRGQPRPAPVVVRPAPARIQTAPPAPLGTRRVASACPGGSSLSQKYMTGGGRTVRCGPQSDHPSAYATQGATGGTRYASAAIRVPALPEIAPPPGYKPAFEEDRFNPNRGLQTREGFTQMRLVWTSGVPRRLVDQNTGRDVTKLFPNLRFPFLTMQQQKRYYAVNATVVPSGNPATVVRQSPNVRISTKAQPPAQAAPPRQTPVRTATPTKPTKPAASGHRYVQVGTFGNESNARNTAAKLKAMGLPAKLGSYTKGGRVYRIVVAGPYNSAGSLQNGLAAVRRAGFGDAYTRR